eukprot:763868-Hanusia_phi.AAC.2
MSTWIVRPEFTRLVESSLAILKQADGKNIKVVQSTKIPADIILSYGSKSISLIILEVMNDLGIPRERLESIKSIGMKFGCDRSAILVVCNSNEDLFSTISTAYKTCW